MTEQQPLDRILASLKVLSRDELTVLREQIETLLAVPDHESAPRRGEKEPPTTDELEARTPKKLS